MKTKLVTMIFAIAFLFPLSLTSQNIVADFNAQSDFSITLEKLNKLIESGNEETIPTNKILFITGTISTKVIKSEEGEPFLAEIELISGKWEGLESVRIYKLLATMNGAEFEALFNEDETIPLPNGAEVLIVCNYKGINTSNKKYGTIPIVNCINIRKID